MAEHESPVGIEEQMAAVDEWVERLSSQDEVGQIERETARAVLEAHGANFEIDGAETVSLQKWTNEGNGPAVRAVWGKALSVYKRWTEEYIASYEQEHGVKLPHIRHESKKTGKITYRKNSGMLRFFYLMTRYAAFSDDSDPQFPFEKLKEELETRAINGRKRAQGVTDEVDAQGKERFLRLVRPDTNEVYKPSSFPPGFPKVGWKHIKSWRTIPHGTS